MPQAPSKPEPGPEVDEDPTIEDRRPPEFTRPAAPDAAVEQEEAATEAWARPGVFSPQEVAAREVQPPLSRPAPPGSDNSTVATDADADPLADTQEHELEQQHRALTEPVLRPEAAREAERSDRPSCRQCGRRLGPLGRPRIFRRADTAVRCERCRNLYCRDHALRITGFWRSLRAGPKYHCAFCLSGPEAGAGHSPTTNAPR